jgi:hypothetical protein
MDEGVAMVLADAVAGDRLAMMGSAVALVVLPAVVGEIGMELRIRRSRWTLATIDAAEIVGTRRSPLTIEW